MYFSIKKSLFRELSIIFIIIGERIYHLVIIIWSVVESH